MFELCFIVFDFFLELFSLYAKYTEWKRTLVSLRSRVRAYNMNQNMGINDDDPKQNIPAPVDVHGQLLPDALCEHQ